MASPWALALSRRIVMKYRWITAGVLVPLLLCGCMQSFGFEASGRQYVPQDIRENSGIEWMLPEKANATPKDNEWKTVYPKVRVQVFNGPAVTAKPTVTIPFKQPVSIRETRKDASGNPEWLRIELPSAAGESWVEARHMARSLDAFISQRFDGVDYGPVSKTVEYPGNPRVPVKGIYVTINTASSDNLEPLIRLAEETEINAFVIDVKDDYGRMLFHTKAASLFCPEANKGAPVKDIRALMRKLKEKNIYAIARIVTFKTPNYAQRYPERAVTDTAGGDVYQSSDGLHWASAYDRQLWRYNIEVAKEAAEAGFNEIQFDYVRFPDVKPSVEGRLDYKNTWNESKTLAIYRYLRFARAELEPYRVYIAADTFGWTASSLGDENIGQHWETLSNAVDYNCPMMYPSHYGPGNFGLRVPDAAPYATIAAGIKDAMARDANLSTPAVLRPWIQDFTAKWVKGHIPYGAEEVRAQIQALEDNGVHEFLIWNASNRYTRPALKDQ